MRGRVLRFVLPVLAIATAAAHAGNVPAPEADPPASAAQPKTGTPTTAAAQPPAPTPGAATSRWGTAHVFQASYVPSIVPLPLIRLHSWTVHMTDAAGRPVTGAEISIVGGMPEHTHGFPTVPEVRELGAGDYRVDGLKFHMPGKWIVVLAVRLPDGTHDTVRFDVEVR